MEEQKKFIIVRIAEIGITKCNLNDIVYNDIKSDYSKIDNIHLRFGRFSVNPYTLIPKKTYDKYPILLSNIRSSCSNNSKLDHQDWINIIKSVKKIIFDSNETVKRRYNELVYRNPYCLYRYKLKAYFVNSLLVYMYNIQDAFRANDLKSRIIGFPKIVLFALIFYPPRVTRFEHIWEKETSSF